MTASAPRLPAPVPLQAVLGAKSQPKQAAHPTSTARAKASEAAVEEEDVEAYMQQFAPVDKPHRSVKQQQEADNARAVSAQRRRAAAAAAVAGETAVFPSPTESDEADAIAADSSAGDAMWLSGMQDAFSA
jgi:hypothetical protein